MQFPIKHVILKSQTFLFYLWNNQNNTKFINLFLVIPKQYSFLYKNTWQWIDKSDTLNNIVK